MQIYIEKIKKFLMKIWDNFYNYLKSLTAQSVGRIFFWFFIVISLISTLAIYFFFIKISPQSGSPSSQGASINMDNLNKVKDNIDKKQSFQPQAPAKDPFAF